MSAPEEEGQVSGEMKREQDQGNYSLHSSRSLNNMAIDFQRLKQNLLSATVPSGPVDLRKTTICPAARVFQHPHRLQGGHHTQTSDPSSCDTQWKKTLDRP